MRMAKPQQPDPRRGDDRTDDTAPDEPIPTQQELIETVGDKARRRLAARQKSRHSLWYGLGAFGVIGWSVAIPTLIGAAIGLWLDVTWPAPFSWTLALLLAGVAVGIFNAWFWMSQEQRAMEAEKAQRRRSGVEQVQEPAPDEQESAANT